MSLREEIEDILKTTIIGRYVGVDEDIIKKSVFIDLILTAFEKRIDEMPSRFEYKEIEYAMGFAEACIKFKEILK